MVEGGYQFNGRNYGNSQNAHNFGYRASFPSHPVLDVFCNPIFTKVAELPTVILIQFNIFQWFLTYNLCIWCTFIKSGSFDKLKQK